MVTLFYRVTFFMKIFRRSLLIFVLLLILVYVTNITAIPNKIILFEGEDLNLGTIFGVNLKENRSNFNVIRTSSSINNSYSNSTYTVNLFNSIKVKEVEVETIPKTEVVPLGNVIGLKLYTSGVLVVGLTEVNGEKPYKNSGIEEGDLITSINENKVTTTEELTECVNKCNGKEIKITYIKQGEECTANVEPTKVSNNEYKLGLWVRDGAAGVGTITYYEPSTKKFAALGHGIVDIDTEDLITIANGNIVTTNVTEIVKGEKGEPRRNKRNYYKRH